MAVTFRPYLRAQSFISRVAITCFVRITLAQGNSQLQAVRHGQWTGTESNGGLPVDWEVKATQLQQEVEALKSENRKLSSERDIRLGSQRTLDHFLARHRASPKPLDFVSSEFQDSRIGASPIVWKPSPTSNLSNDAFSHFQHRPVLRTSFDASGDSEETSEWVDAGTVSNILQRSGVGESNLLSKVDRKRQQKGWNGDRNSALASDHPERQTSKTQATVPRDFPSIVDAVRASIRDLEVTIEEGMFAWDGHLSLKTNTTICGRQSSQLAGSWELAAASGGFLRDLRLFNEFDSCVTASAGRWVFLDCAVQSSGQSAIADPNPHTRMSTAMYCNGAARIELRRCRVGGLDRERAASWAVFGCADSSMCLLDSALRFCDESAVECLDDASVSIRNCSVDHCGVGLRLGGFAKVDVSSSTFSLNEAALEATGTEPSLRLQGNVFKGEVWASSERPSKMEENGTERVEGPGMPRRPLAPFSFQTQRAAGVSDEESSEIENPHDRELSSDDRAKNLRLVAERALSRANQDIHLTPLSMYDSE